MIRPYVGPRVFFFVKAELRKFGEVRSHPPHPPWLRHCVVLEISCRWFVDILVDDVYIFKVGLNVEGTGLQLPCVGIVTTFIFGCTWKC